MGAQESKQQNVPSTPETPQFATYAKLFALTEDPRSPGDIRTPMLVQEKLVDPRSPTDNNDAGRTPIFSIPEPISPFVRFKMENLAYQDSPLSGYLTKDVHTECNTDENISDIILSEKLKNMDFDADKIGQPSNILDTNKQDLSDEAGKPRLIKKRQRRSSSKARQSLLKTALFKPYVDDENLITNEQVEITPKKDHKENVNVTPKRTPLASRNFVLFTNENTASTKKFEQSHQENVPTDLQIAKRKLTLRELSIACDKENVVF